MLCPVHRCLLEFHSWTTKLTQQSPRNPRLVHDLQGNIIRIQSICRCNQNLPNHTTPGHEYYSASTEILNVVPLTIKERFPIKLFYRSTCTKDLLDYVMTHIGHGQNSLELSENIGSMNFEAFIRNHKDSLDLNNFMTLLYLLATPVKLDFFSCLSTFCPNCAKEILSFKANFKCIWTHFSGK